MLRQFTERMWDRREANWEKDFLSDTPKGGMTIQAGVDIINVPRIELSDEESRGNPESARFVAELHREFGRDLDFTDEAVLDAVREWAETRLNQ